MFRRKPKKCLSFLIPVLLAATTGSLFVSLWPVAGPIRRSLFYSRDYVEFLMYDVRHHIKAEVRRNGYKHKKWTVRKHYSETSYQVVYDPTDKIVKEDDTDGGGCYTTVFSLGDHFYFVRGECPGIL